MITESKNHKNENEGAMCDDLRHFIKRAQENHDCRIIQGADWDLEIGAVTEIQRSISDSPLLLFDTIKGYPKGYRVATNVLNTDRRVNMVLGLPLEATGVEQVKAWRRKTREGITPVTPAQVETGPIKENIQRGDEVDIFKFPVPKWHELDGGRYIGTGDVVIQRDPDEGWVNLGTYRVQAHDRNTATIHIVKGHHGDLIQKKYWDKGQAAPAVVLCGVDPLLYYIGSAPLPWGVAEYEYAGGFRNKPIEVVEGEFTDLPIPATAEIALEGELLPPGTETRIEGPFGEWEGYFAGEAREEPVFRIKAVLHRNNPIIYGAPPLVGTFENAQGRIMWGAAALWDELDRQMVGVKGVWMPPEARNTLMVIISIKQMFSGHAQQAAMLAAGSYGTAWMNRFIIVVDEDIDPSKMGEVLWALTTRCDPAESIDILRGCWGARSDPLLSPAKRTLNQIDTSKAVIYACKPYHWINEFPPPVKSSPEFLEKMRLKFLSE